MIVDLPNSAVALAVSDIVREKNKVAIGSGAGTAALTGAKCSPNFVHWTYDTWAFGHGTARGVLAPGGKTWFFITADYAFGQVSRSRRPMKSLRVVARCLAAYVIQSAPMISHLSCSRRRPPERMWVALANAGGDTVNTIKQAADFKLGDKQKIVALIFDLQAVPALGLQKAQGLQAINAWYWDLNNRPAPGQTVSGASP